MPGDCLAHLDAPTSYWGLHGTWTWNHCLKFTVGWIWVPLSESLIDTHAWKFQTWRYLLRTLANDQRRYRRYTAAGGFDSDMQERRVSMWRVWHQHLIFILFYLFLFIYLFFGGVNIFGGYIFGGGQDGLRPQKQVMLQNFRGVYWGTRNFCFRKRPLHLASPLWRRHWAHVSELLSFSVFSFWWVSAYRPLRNRSVKLCSRINQIQEVLLYHFV